MTDHEKFKALLDSVGLTYASLADAIGMKYDSVKNQLAPAKSLPKWAVSMLLLGERWEKINEIMEKVFKTAHIRFLEQQIAKGNISYSKMVELLNKIAHNYYVVSKNCNLQNVTNCNFKTVVALYEDVNSKLAVSEQILPVHKGDKMTIDDTCYEVDYVDYNFDKAIFEIVVTDDS